MRTCAALAALTYLVCAAHGCSRGDDDDDVSSTRSVDTVEAVPVDDATAESATAESATAESATAESATAESATAESASATSTTDAGQSPEPPASTSASAGTTPPQSLPLDTIEAMGDVPTAEFTWFGGLGNWFIVQSGHIRDAVVEPLESEQQGSEAAFHLLSDAEPSPAMLYAELWHPLRRPVDLSAFWGVYFSARSPAEDELIVRFSSSGTDAGLSNEPAATEARFRLTDAWQRLEVPFAEIGLDASAVVSIDFVVGADGEDYDVWIDELGVVCNGACP